MRWMPSDMKAEYLGSCFCVDSKAESWYRGLPPATQNQHDVLLDLFLATFASQQAPCTDISTKSNLLNQQEPLPLAPAPKLALPDSARAGDAPIKADAASMPSIAKSTTHTRVLKEELRSSGKLATFINFRNYKLPDIEGMPMDKIMALEHSAWAKKMLSLATSLPSVPDKVKRTVFKTNAGRIIAKMTVLSVGDTDFQRMADYVVHLPASDIVQFKLLSERSRLSAKKRPRSTVLTVFHVVASCGDRFIEEPIEITHDDRLHLWRIKNNESRITSQSDVPLTPGTAPAGWRECWTCGQVEPHTWKDCPNEPLPREERIFRAEVAKSRMGIPA